MFDVRVRRREKSKKENRYTLIPLSPRSNDAHGSGRIPGKLSSTCGRPFHHFFAWGLPNAGISSELRTSRKSTSQALVFEKICTVGVAMYHGSATNQICPPDDLRLCPFRPVVELLCAEIVEVFSRYSRLGISDVHTPGSCTGLVWVLVAGRPN